MADFDVAHALELLRAADRLLERPERLVVIGGMALALSRHKTSRIGWTRSRSKGSATSRYSFPSGTTWPS